MVLHKWVAMGAVMRNGCGKHLAASLWRSRARYAAATRLSAQVRAAFTPNAERARAAVDAARAQRCDAALAKKYAAHGRQMQDSVATHRSSPSPHRGELRIGTDLRLIGHRGAHGYNAWPAVFWRQT